MKFLKTSVFALIATLSVGTAMPAEANVFNLLLQKKHHTHQRHQQHHQPHHQPHHSRHHRPSSHRRFSHGVRNHPHSNHHSSNGRRIWRRGSSNHHRSHGNWHGRHH